MDFRRLAVDGALEVTPDQFHDERGTFAEGFRVDHLAEWIGRPFTVRQTNVSVSVAGAVRGVHYADLPPSQAKYVTAVSGIFLDVVIDLRVGSPTFLRHDSVRLDTTSRRSVYVPEGVGHMLVCLEEGTAHYLCSEVFAPARERGIRPDDPALGLSLPLPEGFAPIVSAKDAAAPSLEEARAAGLLPTYAAYQDWTRTLGSRTFSPHPGN